jgi:predicted RNA-binding Zn-ribbon protein involved in translation (DUF1610 family)
MASPCPRCGKTKTESVRHGYVHNTLWNWGYHLRRCSFCNRWRLFRRTDPNERHPDDMTREELQEHFNRKIAESLEGVSAAPEIGEEFMANEPSEQSGKIRSLASSSSVGLAEEEVQDHRLCPNCGSTIYRRSHRRWYERILSRPKMARCMKCDRRFPYPH